MKVSSEILASPDNNTSDSNDSQVKVELPTFERKVETEYEDQEENMVPNQDPVDVELTNTNYYQLVRDRQRRAIKLPQKYGYAYADVISFALTVASEIDDTESTSVKDAMSSSDKMHWVTAMKEEVDSLEKIKLGNSFPNLKIKE